MEHINKLNKIFTDTLDKKVINQTIKKKFGSHNTAFLRTVQNGVSVQNALEYLMLYTKKELTEEICTSLINLETNNSFTRQSLNAKAQNIHQDVFITLLNKLQSMLLSFNDSKDIKYIAIDGVNNNLRKGKQNVNLGVYDITNDGILDIKDCKSKNQIIELSESKNILVNIFLFFKIPHYFWMVYIVPLICLIFCLKIRLCL
jgi:hypothetical protein